VGDQRFQRRDHRERLDRLAQCGDAVLQLLGIGALPVVVDVADGRRLTLQVAEMHPAAPFFRPSSRNTSEPGNTSKPG
jgi:hypothetical protein